MNNLKELLKQYFHLLVFLILQIFAIVLIYQNNTYQHFAISTALQNITGPVLKFTNQFYKHFQYASENADLLQQNIELLREKDNMYLFPNDSVFTVFSGEGRNKRRMYDYTTAHVVFSTVNKTNNYIIIDKGKNDGITPDMAVLSLSNGIVGVISDVSDNFSTVISLLNSNSRISAKIPSINQIGTVVWLDNDPTIAQVTDITQHSLVVVGDSVVTSGNSDVYPKNILIGTVFEKFDTPNNSFLTIKIQLNTDFRNLNSVYLVTNLYKSELNTLKSKLKDE
jgi:rod shape-determining protein MreC